MSEPFKLPRKKRRIPLPEAVETRVTLLEWTRSETIRELEKDSGTKTSPAKTLLDSWLLLAHEDPKTFRIFLLDLYWPPDKRRGSTEKDCAGYIVLDADPRRSGVQVVRILVRPCYRRQGLGSTLLREASRFAEYRDRSRLYLSAPEEALDLHLFLRREGWRAESVVNQGRYSTYLFSKQLRVLEPLLTENV